MKMGPSTALVPDVDEQLSDALIDGLGIVESRLRDVVATDDAMVRWTSRHLMDAGGKRVRPLLTLLAGELGTEPGSDRVLDAAVLVELTHLATLYHDDVMDDADTRRGAAAAHEVWGNLVAILTGDFLFARASALSAGLGPEAVRIHAHTFERLCMGQLHETVGVREGDDPFEHYLQVLADKTASLIATAGELGAMMGGASADVAHQLREYGEIVGVAFQLADDVIDLRADPDQSGKTPGTDLREGVPTMPTLLIRRRAAQGDDSPETRALVQALDSDLSTDEALASTVQLLREDPAVDETQEMAESMAREAIQKLLVLPESPARNALIDLTESLVRRTS